MLTDALFRPPHASGRSSPSGGALLRRSETEARSAFTPLTPRPSFSQSAGVWTLDRRSVSCVSVQRGGGDTEAAFASACFSAAAQTCRDWKSSSHCCLVIVDADMWSAASQRDHGWCEKTSGSSPLTSCSGGTQRVRELKRPRTTRLRGQKWIQHLHTCGWRSSSGQLLCRWAAAPLPWRSGRPRVLSEALVPG